MGKSEPGLATPIEQADRESTLVVRRMGFLPYEAALELQSKLVVQRRGRDIPDTLLLLQHPHVITLGSGTHLENLLLSPAELSTRGIETHRAGRGGDVTYHGPGQLIGYPILELKPLRRDLHKYLRDLEEVLIRVLGDLGLRAGRLDGLTGVWIGDRKVAAIGVRVSSGWITSHGFALNVDPDLTYFDTIVPCGIQDRRVGSIADELGYEVEMAEVEAVVESRFLELFVPV